MKEIRILAIDDVRDNLVTLGALVKESFPSADFFMSTNGAQGMELARKESPDVILLDIVMPGMDGYEVCRMLKQDETLCQIPVVFLTALRTDTESRVKALDAGAEGFLSKPIDQPELHAQICAMFKIRQANRMRQMQQQQLEELVARRTKELEDSRNDLLKLYENLLIANEKAEESNRLKTAFLQNISHEIRTPMNGILGFAELLRDSCLTPDQIKEYVDIIEQSGKRMLHVINDILDLSKIETGQVEAQIQEAPINGLMHDLMVFFRPEAQAKELSLSLHCDLPDQQDIVVTDFPKLSQVLSNLLKNALKFTLRGSVSFGYKVCEGELEFFVRDTGVGIPELQKEIIFERFIQGNMTLTRDFEGTGLGLSIARSLVQLLGGRIWVESAVGKGSDFRFRIPLIHPGSPAQTIVPGKTQTLMPGTYTVLVVEDDNVSRMYLKSLLRTAGLNVRMAKNGEEAVEWVSMDANIQVVLMDMKMPVLDGFEATRRIKNLRPSLPVIAQTAYAFREERRLALEAGCDDVLTKPVQGENILETIRQVIHKAYDKVQNPSADC